MPGSATLGTNLVDSLLTMVDDLRGSLNPDMGVRQWRVFVVRRTWAGGAPGVGSYSDVETELTPQPLVKSYDLQWQPIPAGMNEQGNIMLHEVSLTYTEAELSPPYVAGSELFYCLRDAQGQAIRDRYYQLMEPPKPDRVRTIGWLVKLKVVTVDGCPP